MLRKLITILFLVMANFCKGEEPVSLNTSSIQNNNAYLIGFKAGLTFTQPIVLQRFNILSAVDPAVSQSGTKKYLPFFRNLGYQYAFTLLWKFSDHMDLRIEPTFATYIYQYHVAFFWENSSNNSERIDMRINHNQSIKYFEIPVTMRHLIGSGKLRPFTQAGIFVGFLQSAIKTSKQIETYTNALGTSVLDNETISGGSSTLYNNLRFGIHGGFGVDYEFNSIHLTLDVNLNFGINNVTDKSTRYSMQQYSGGLYDVQDNVKLLVPSINIGILIPLLKSPGPLKCPTL